MNDRTPLRIELDKADRFYVLIESDGTLVCENVSSCIDGAGEDHEEIAVYTDAEIAAAAATAYGTPRRKLKWREVKIVPVTGKRSRK